MNPVLKSLGLVMIIYFTCPKCILLPFVQIRVLFSLTSLFSRTKLSYKTFDDITIFIYDSNLHVFLPFSGMHNKIGPNDTDNANNNIYLSFQSRIFVLRWADFMKIYIGMKGIPVIMVGSSIYIAYMYIIYLLLYMHYRILTPHLPSV